MWWDLLIFYLPSWANINVALLQIAFVGYFDYEVCFVSWKRAEWIYDFISILGLKKGDGVWNIFWLGLTF